MDCSPFYFPFHRLPSSFHCRSLSIPFQPGRDKCWTLLSLHYKPLLFQYGVWPCPAQQPACLAFYFRSQAAVKIHPYFHLRKLSLYTKYKSKLEIDACYSNPTILSNLFDNSHFFHRPGKKCLS